jgi:hypothetical protein
VFVVREEKRARGHKGKYQKFFVKESDKFLWESIAQDGRNPVKGCDKHQPLGEANKKTINHPSIIFFMVVEIFPTIDL